MRKDLPVGTVTFLFTDVEGSTRLLHELGPELYAEALQEHRRAFRESFVRYGGCEVDTQGDAFFVAFPTAAGAVASARDAQSGLAGGPIGVRMALHTGTAHLAPEGYVGADVHLGARIAAAGHGGQVLLSAATRHLVDAPVIDLGEHRFKDFAQPVAVYQLGEGRFPPLRTISNTNLPRPASSFLGRTREVDGLVSLVREGARLITLTGPGGTGKTRLAIEAAASIVGEFESGVFWIPLATIRDPRLVVETIGKTVGSANGPGPHIGNRELMLVLDNLEQVVEAAPELSGLVADCPNLRLLVTSRELLRVDGEVEFPVPPLEEADAVELFCDRSRREPEAEVIELCRRLDNLPLAVELAAARTRIMEPAQILERVSQRLDLLRGGRDAEARQMTLRATIEWSHDLLTAGEQELFARLAVFVGGCTLEAAETVAEADLDTMQSLVDKSLVRHTGDRFWMLETIREFAAEKLEERADAEALHRRHAENFLALAESAHCTFDWVDHHPEVVRPDIDNVRSAIAWALAAADRELAVRIATALEMFWTYTNPIEGMRWFETLLDGSEDLPPQVRARAFLAYGAVANPGGDDALAERMYRESLRAYESLGDDHGVAEATMRLGVAAMYRGDLVGARDFAVKALEMARRGRYQSAEALSLWAVGEIEWRLGNESYGMELIAQSADLAGEIGFSWQRSRMLRRLADWALEHGDLEEARRAGEESLQLAYELGDRISIVFSLARLARIAGERGDRQRAGLLWGAVEAEEESGALGAWYGERERFTGPLDAFAGPEFDEGREEGHRLSLDEAVQLGLEA